MPRVTREPPPLELVERLAVLRRAQTPDDRPEDDPSFESMLGPPGVEVSIDYVRRLADGPNGERFFLVPCRWPAIGDPMGFVVGGGGGGGSAGEAGVELEPEGIRLSVMHIDADGSGGGGGGAADLRALLENMTMGGSGSGKRAVTAGLVPDGIESVTLDDGMDSERHVPVRDNFWVARGDPSYVTWRGRDGVAVRTFKGFRHLAR